MHTYQPVHFSHTMYGFYALFDMYDVQKNLRHCYKHKTVAVESSTHK